MLIERTPGYAISVLNTYRVGREPGELLRIVNAYCINSMCLDLALEARKHRMITIVTLTSGNLPGGDEANRLMIDRCIPRGKHLM
jgi:uncharacterized phosphosugar-binding protein